MKRLSILTLQFYQLLLLYNIAFTLLATFVLALMAGRLSTGIFIFAKVLGFMAAIGLHYYSSKQTYFYFRNAGYRIVTLFTTGFVFDVAACLIIILLPSPLQHASAYFKD